MTGSRELAELRATLDGTGDGVIVADAAGRVTRMSPVASRLTGWSEIEALGKTLDEVFQSVDEHSGTNLENPAERILRGRGPAEEATDAVLIARGGRRAPSPLAGCLSWTRRGVWAAWS